jgi:hypothetical protein
LKLVDGVGAEFKCSGVELERSWSEFLEFVDGVGAEFKCSGVELERSWSEFLEFVDGVGAEFKCSGVELERSWSLCFFSDSDLTPVVICLVRRERKKSLLRMVVHAYNIHDIIKRCRHV